MNEETDKRGSERPLPLPDTRATYTSILQEHDIDRLQRDARIKLLSELELKKLNKDKSPVGTIGYVAHDQLSASDIPVLGNMLLQIGEVDTLNLILHSPGGDGTVVETFVSLCRTHCKKRFCVVIPTIAKSAATLISLGADEIIMGPPSEIGPIDAQVPILVSGVRRYVSAQSFIDARDNLLKQHAEAIESDNNPAAILQMIASLDLPFITECERLMEFGRDVGKKLLVRYMFARKKNQAQAQADNVVKQLSSVELHKVHGRNISAAIAKQQLGLKVRMCGNDDPFWKKAWEWYTRAEIFMNRINAVKMFETKHEHLAAVRHMPAM